MKKINMIVDVSTHDEIKELIKKALKDHFSVYYEFPSIELVKEQAPLLPFWPEYFDPSWNIVKCSKCGVLFQTDDYKWNCPNCDKVSDNAPEWAKDDDE